MSDAPLVVHVFPSFAIGGAQVRYAALANRFKARWRHVVVALDGNGACVERISPEVPLTFLPAQPGKSQGLPSRLWNIRSTLRRLRPDVLVTGNWGSIEWAMANMLPPRLKHLHTEDGFGPEEATGQLPRRVLTRRVALRRSTVILPSTTLLGMARDVWRLPSHRLHYIPNGLDLNRFNPRGPAARIDVAGEGPLIGTVAALRAEKALDRLLRACALLAASGAAFRLAVVGEGPERRNLEALALELGIRDRVCFTGHLADPAEAYRAIDHFALSSATEQMPFSVLEAMASGLPVGATNVGDVRAMLAGENLSYVTENTDASLAAALRQLIEQPGLRARIGLANRRRAETDFDQEQMFQAYARLIEA
jgi:glycosyltransferase involved in cell wall biosynthesis